MKHGDTAHWHRVTADPGYNDPEIVSVQLFENLDEATRWQAAKEDFFKGEGYTIKRDVAPIVIVDLPQRFYADHAGRELRAGTIVKKLARHYRVALDEQSFDSLLSDAEHYSVGDEAGFDWEFDRGLILSAKATVKALSKVEKPFDAF